MSYSQEPLLEKIQYKGSNAFVGNEIVMDSIFNKYKSWEFLSITVDSLKIRTDLLLKELEKIKIESDMFRKKSETLIDINKTFEDRIDNQAQKHETEILYYKEKAKGKFKSFLLGTGIGGLIVAILTLI